jgi:hypothetical protein
MASDKTIFLIGGVGLLYLLSKNSSPFVGPRPYPTPTGTGTGTTPPKPGGSGGGSSGGGGSPGGGFTPGGGGSGAGTGGTPTRLYVCADGSLVTDPSQCPTGYQPVGGECSDSTYVDDVATQCPENVNSYVDTMDPCDPNSIAYDPSQCGYATGTDTGPPLDANGIPYGDTMDPCDPSSVFYEPTECYDYSSG